MENITREVIADLWPIYSAGEASADTRALVDAFVRGDPAFAQTLKDVEGQRFAGLEPPPLSPDHELKTLERVKKRLTGPTVLLQMAIVFSCFAFGSLVSDTSFDVSPRRFIATAAVALCFWIVFLVRLFRGRREVLIRVRS